MTNIRIPFTKTKIEKQGTQGSVKWIDLEINTKFLMSQIEPNLDKLHGGNPDGSLARMRFVFFDNAEPTLYQTLLDKTNFELSFSMEKVNYGVGGEEGEVDGSKPEVNLYQAPTSRMLEVYFKPQFAGIIKLVESGQKNPHPNPNDPGTPPPPLTLRKILPRNQIKISFLIC